MSRNDRPSARAREESEDVGRNDSANATLGDVIAERYAQRDVLKGALGVAAISATMPWDPSIAAVGRLRVEYGPNCHSGARALASEPGIQ
jgi:hypothetical protein